MQQKILLVENNLDLRENITEILEIQNYKVFSVCNGKEGLAMAKLQKPDLILCAIKMPEMNGLQLLEHIRKISSLSSALFVFFTTSGEKKDIETGFKMGADDYIVKPCSAEELLYKLRKLLAKK